MYNPYVMIRPVRTFHIVEERLMKTAADVHVPGALFRLSGEINRELQNGPSWKRYATWEG